MPSEIKRFKFEPSRSGDAKFAAIFVPQGCCAFAQGPQNNVHYITTFVGPCVAVALLGYAKDKSCPMIAFAHLDDAVSPNLSTRVLIRYAEQFFDKSFTPSKAYLLNGMDHPRLYHPVLGELEKTGFDCYANIEDIPYSMTIDLATGQPVRGDMDSIPTYMPNERAEMALENYVFSLPRNPSVLPIFDLRKGMPDFYTLNACPSPIVDTNPFRR